MKSSFFFLFCTWDILTPKKVQYGWAVKSKDAILYMHRDSRIFGVDICWYMPQSLLPG